MTTKLPEIIQLHGDEFAELLRAVPHRVSLHCPFPNPHNVLYYDEDSENDVIVAKTLLELRKAKSPYVFSDGGGI